MKKVCIVMGMLFLVLVTSGTVIAASATQNQTSQSSTNLTYINPSIPESGCYVGAYLGGGQQDDSSETIQDFNQIMGKNHSVFSRYVDIGDSKNPDHLIWAEELKNNGAMPIFVYEPWTGGLEGIDDDNVQYFANKCRDLNITVFIVFGHEMNGNWYSWGQKPELFKEKFKEIANIFHTTSPKVQMCWVPNQNWGYPWRGTDYGDGYTEYYPDGGSVYCGEYRDYVDWVGLNFYDRDYDNDNQIPANMFIANIKNGKENENAPYINFYDTFALKKNKPMIIAETGAFDSTLDSTNQINNKNNWISQVYNISTLQNEFPMLHAICYFHVKKNDSGVISDFRIPLNGVYKTLITDSYFINASDFVPPLVKITEPANSAVNVPRNQVIKIIFSEPVLGGTYWIELKNSTGTTIYITKSITGNVLTITPSSLLATGTKYTIYLHTGCVKDYAGNLLAGVTKSFTTTTDGTAPTVTSTDPANNAVNVPQNKVITVIFNEPIKAGNMWIELYNAVGTKTLIPITTSISGNILTINHSALLANGTKYTLAFHTGSITDLTGNSLAGVASYFTTNNDAIITTTDPVNNAVNVARNKVITVTFNKPIKTGNMWIELYNTVGTKTLIPITTSISGNVLTINHSALLANGTKYTLAFHTGSITDLTGNSLAGVARYFTTSTDITAPTITNTEPANNAVNVPRNKVITVTFNEPIKAGNMWIELYNTSGTKTPIAITTSISGNVLTINHAALLANGTKYTLAFHTGSITDNAGNPVASAVRYFTTGSV